ncbi:multidrug efflux SMR transporter [Rhizobium sp. L1K21]|uniref:DMT family transporter n=1 Tax=Rhizobium sp. L1K21 TaxID=2954933 RepID=UPI0020937C99|nr:multidrug efflux SMR transporter [Rhizobium sp. L1K21]MCO6186200.1 multidrug efflux SMR transporter [Rhizobium sp. L1K21]
MSPALAAYAALFAAIVLEVFGMFLLKQSEQFTRALPTILCLALFIGSIYFLTLSLKTMPVGIAYAIWSAACVVIVALIGWIFYNETLDAGAIIGLGLIVSGITVVNLFSSSGSH